MTRDRDLLIAVLVVVLALMAWACPARAQTCRDLQGWHDRLERGYGESVQGRGIVHDGRRVVLIYANVETGSWTILVRQADGTACGLASGEGYERTDTAPLAMGEDG